MLARRSDTRRRFASGAALRQVGAVGRQAGAHQPVPPEDPRDGSSGPPWTVLGAVGRSGAMAVDATGRIVTGRNGWSLGWEVLTGTHRLVPGVESKLRQRAAGVDGAAPVGLETVLRTGDGDVSQLAYVCLAPTAGAGALGVVELRNDTSVPVAVTLTLQPGDFWRSAGLWRVQLDAVGVLANGSPVLWWERPPAEARASANAAAETSAPGAAPQATGARREDSHRARSRQGRAGVTMTWPVAHRTALRVLLPLHATDSGPPVPASVPTLGQVGRGWDAHGAEGLRVDGLASGRVAAVAAAAVRRLLALDVGPEASESPDGRLSPAERALLAAALAIAGFPQRAAEVVSVRAAWSPDALARLASREAAQITERFGGGAAAVGAMAAGAGPTGGWASGRGGDDPVYRGAYLLALRDLLVAERDGNLDLLGGIGASVDFGTERPPIEVHRLGTPWGVVSFAVRWHGAAPALLWEIVPPTSRVECWSAVLAGAGTDGERGRASPPSPRISATALATTWSTRQLVGETLLRP